jgi:hypothetical protein
MRSDAAQPGKPQRPIGPGSWLVFVLTLLAHAAVTRGRPVIGPDTQLYVRLADGFRASDFSGTFNLDAVRWTKTLYMLVLAAARSMAPELWPHLMMALNVACSAILAAMVIDLVRRATHSSVAAWVALAFYLGCFEIFRWIPHVMTDMPFIAASFWPLYVVGRRLIDPSDAPGTGTLAMSLLLAMFTRPPGALLVPLVVTIELVAVRRVIRFRTAAAVIFALAAAAFAVRTVVVNDPATWPFRFVKPKLIEFSAREKAGEVVLGRVESYRPPVRDAADHIVMTGDRFVRYFQFVTLGYSTIHNVANFLFFAPLYLLGIAGLIDAMAGHDVRRRALACALAFWIVASAYFSALTLLDAQWRYRAPFISAFILLAALGTEAVTRRFSGGALRRAA